MNDGHSRVEGKDFDENQTRSFRLKLSFNKEASGRKIFVIHASSSILSLSGGLTPFDFLQHLGFHHYQGNCPHYHNQCLYLETWQLPDRDLSGYPRETEYAHDQIRSLTRDIDEMYDKMKDVSQKLSRHMELFPLAARYDQKGSLPVLDRAGSEPGWLYEYKIDQHKKAEKELQVAKEAIDKFNLVTFSLWGTGDQLEDSILSILKDMGFEASKTEKGFTVDIIARLNEVGVFAFEITGINDAVKKKSNKITQAFSFLQEHHQGEKIVILANTFNDIPPKEREQKEHFTEEVTKLIQPQGFVGMTCFDLYRIWRDVRFGGKSVAEIFRNIFSFPGGHFKYS